MTDSTDPGITLRLALRSDPPWLVAGIVAVTGVLLAGFMGLFVAMRQSPALGLIPGLTCAVFAGSALAAWGRRRGATLALELAPTRWELHGADAAQTVLDLARPCAAVLLTGTRAGRRMLVVGQHGDLTVLLETGVAPTEPGAFWRPRTVALDLEALALSPASAEVLALAHGSSLDPLLKRLEPCLEDSAPWILQCTPGGSVLSLRPGHVAVGRTALVLGAGRRVVHRAVETKGGSVAALEITEGPAERHDTVPEGGASLLLACEDAAPAPGAEAAERSPDAYLSLLAWELVRAVVGAP